MYQLLDRHGQAPLSCQEEVAGIIGNGVVGKLVESMCSGQLLQEADYTTQDKGSLSSHATWG